MRILSQDRMRDIPYEQVAVIQDASDKRKIVATGVNTEGEYSYFPMAEYSTEAKAKRAMGMLRNFNEIREVRNIPLKRNSEELIDPLKKFFKICVYESDDILKMDLVKAENYFQFPADYELEN